MPNSIDHLTAHQNIIPELYGDQPATNPTDQRINNTWQRREQTESGATAVALVPNPESSGVLRPVYQAEGSPLDAVRYLRRTPKQFLCAYIDEEGEPVLISRGLATNYLREKATEKEAATEKVVWYSIEGIAERSENAGKAAKGALTVLVCGVVALLVFSPSFREKVTSGITENIKGVAEAIKKTLPDEKTFFQKIGNSISGAVSSAVKAAPEKFTVDHRCSVQ